MTTRTTPAVTLFPAITAGLRCGPFDPRDDAAWDRALPGHHGRAPLRADTGRLTPHRERPLPGHHGRAPLRGPRRRVLRLRPVPLPGHHGRAPLRERGRGHIDGPCLHLFPAITAGLRCGQVVHERPGRGTRVLFPAITAGLRCGPKSSHTLSMPSGPLPGHHGRAPLRGQPGGALFRCAPASSRPSRPGSVAGTLAPFTAIPRPPPLPGHHGRAPLRTGPYTRTTHSTTLPGHHGRAPLRDIRSGDTARTVVTLPGHHGRAPLRAGVGSRSVHPGELLFPAITAGLRCGTAAETQVFDASAISSRPSRPGSVAG